MAAGTIKLTNGSTAVTGTSTTFTSDFKVGDFIVAVVGGVAYTLGVSAIASNTALTINKAFQGPTTTGLAYTPTPAATLALITTQIAADVARMTRQYNLDKDNWTNLLTQNSPSVTVNMADGTTFTGPSWLYVAGQYTGLAANAIQNRGRPAIAGFTDVNNIGPDANGLGVWSFSASADTSLPNLPEASVGVLEVFAAGFASGSQRYTTAVGTMYIRNLAAVWNASSPSWQEWKYVGVGMASSQLAVDANTLTSQGYYGMASTATNTPVASQGILQVQRFVNNVAYVQQTFKTQLPASSTSSNRTFTRTLQSGTWTAWAEVYTTNSKPLLSDLSGSLSDIAGTLSISKGGSGATTASAARTNFGVGYSNSAANPGGGVYRLFMTDDSGRMCITRRFNVIATANSATAFSYSWSDDGAGTYVGYPGCSVMGESGSSANFKVGVESLTNAKVSGFIHNTGSTNLSVWLTFLVVGIKA